MGANGGRCSGWALDVLLNKSSEGQPDFGSGREDCLLIYGSNSETSSTRSLRSDQMTDPEKFLFNSLQTAPETHWNGIGIKFLIPEADGYMLKSDMLEQRFESKGLTVSGFTAPLQFVRGITSIKQDSVGLPDVVPIAIGAIVLPHTRPETLQDIEWEVDNRLSFQWLSPSHIPRKRLAIVQDPASLLLPRRRWEAAKSLGIDLILVSSSPFLSGEQELFQEIFASYVEVDLNGDAGLARRIAEALSIHKDSLDGIMAVRDHRLASVSEAAKILGLFTSPSAAYEIAEDKYLTRMKEPDVEGTFLVESIEELDSVIASLSKSPFPLVVKPCRGFSGECVAKVSTEEGLRQAVLNALAYAEPRRALIEPYVKGPEVDVNFVLLDGRILFGAACDNFPSQADRLTSDESLYFAETKNLSPSNLPGTEQELLVGHFYQTLISQGFRTGVFHVEGRVRDSCMEYDSDVSGTFDLHTRQQALVCKPSAFLHEVNARPPGFQCCAALLLCFGVDFWALQILCALRDWKRVEALTLLINGVRTNYG